MDIARLQSTPNALNVVLKNTHFRDGILSDPSKIKVQVSDAHALPVLIVQFPEPYYDFIQVLNPIVLIGAEWLDKTPVTITMVISDTVITDELTSVSFYLKTEEVNSLKKQMAAVQKLTPNEVRQLEDTIYSSW